jgi:two-component system sensor histidine kinase YesM
MKAIEWFSSRSLRAQIIAGQLVIMLLVVTGISYLNYRQSSDVMIDNVESYVQQAMQQMDEKLTFSLKQIDRLSASILLNEELRELLSEENEGVMLPMKDKLKIHALLHQQTYFFDLPVSVRILTMRGGVYDNVHTSFIPFQSIKQMEENGWFKAVNQGNGKTVWVGEGAPNDGDPYSSNESAIIGVRLIKNQMDDSIDGYIIVSLHKWALNANLEDLKWGQSGMLFMLDQQSRMMFSNMGIRTSEERERLSALVRISLDEKMEVEHEGKIYRVAQQELSYTGWQFVSLIPVSEINGELMFIRRFIWVVGLLAVFVAISLSYFLTEMITKPVRYLFQGLRNVEQGNFEIKLNIGGNHEVYMLGKAFNRMVERLNGLLQKLAEQQTSEKEARIQALNAQFRPHFLYNTLNIIYWKSIQSGQEQIGDMIVKLSRLLRYSISPGDGLITVKDDMEHIGHYLHLMRERFGDELEIELTYDPEIERCIIPKMLLQPVIENAMVHGLETLPGLKRLIIVGNRTVENTINFEVIDNGIGMEPDHLASIMSDERSSEGSGTGIGLMNIDKRVKAQYGPLYGLRIDSAPGKGTKVTVTMPVIEKRENHG